MRSIYKKLYKVAICFLIGITNISGNILLTNAQETYQPKNIGTIPGTGAEVRTSQGYAYWRAGLGKVEVNNEIAFCIEPLTLGLGGTYSKDDMVDMEIQGKLSLIVYHGWDKTSKTDDDYATVQFMIWEAMGATISKWYGDFGNRYNSLKAEVQKKIDNHYVIPKFVGSDYEVQLGQSLTIEDEKGVLNEFHVSNNGGADVRISGNSLMITPNANTPEELEIELEKIIDDCLGSSIAYRSSADDGQDVAIFKVADPIPINLNVKVLKYGKIEISKQDEDGKYIPNTSFTLSYNQDMSEPIGTYTTGSNGKVLVDLLLPKKVYIQEVAVPEPLILDSTIHEVTVKAQETTSYSQSNDYKKGNLEIQKVDADTGKAIETAGTTFEIYKSDGTYVNTISTNNKGVASLTGLRWGDYYYLEKEAPAFYSKSNEKVAFSIRDHGVTVKTKIANKRTLGSIEIKKVDKETGNTPQGDASIDGATYKLLAGEDIKSPDNHQIVYKKGALVHTFTIQNGKAKIDNLYLGKYNVTESKPGTGYLIDSNTYAVNLNYTNQNQTVEVRSVTSKEQVMKQAFQIIKISSDGASGTTPVLKGAQFTVKLESDVKRVGWDKAKSYDKLITDEDGYAKSIELPYGYYRVRETLVPANHSPVADFFVNVNKDSREPASWIIQNDLPFKTYIGIVKIDAETGDVVRLAGAKFKILNLDTGDYEGWWQWNPIPEYIDEFTTNEDGNVMTPGSLRAGHYKLIETQAPNGMLLNRESKPFTISEDGAHQLGPDGASYVTSITFADAPAKGRLILEKTAELFQGFKTVETEYGTLYQPKFETGLLSGVTYEIKARENVVSADGTRIYYKKGTLVETLKTDGKSATKSSLLPLGAYTLQEISCDDPGYVVDDTIYEFDLIYKDQTTEVVTKTMKPFNEKKRASGTITKDIEASDVMDNSEAYKDIKFGVFIGEDLNINGKKVLDKDSLMQIVSLEDTLKGEIHVDYASEYYLQELTTNDQYVLSNEKIPFNFEYAQDKETVIEINGGKPIENKVKRGNVKILKIDEDTGLPVAGAVFEISRDEEFKTIIATVTSGSDGYAIVESVEKSTIYVREKTPPEGYATNKEVIKAEIVEHGQIIEMTYRNAAYRGFITLHKTEKETERDLSGIIYKVIAEEDIYAIGHPVDEFGNKVIAYYKGDAVSTDISEEGFYMTDETGTIHVGGEAGLPCGLYSIFEVKTLDGFVLDPVKHFVEIAPDSETDPIITREVDAENDFIKVEVSKVNALDKTFVEGATLQLLDKTTGNVMYEWISGKEAERFDRIPAGNYILHEESVPKDSGYVTAPDMEITIKEHSKLQEFVMEDDFTKFDISKTDITTGEEITGATLQILDLEGNVIAEWITNGKPHRIEYLPINTEFILHEEFVADGYVYAEDISFKVEDTGEIQKVKMEDDYTKVHILKRDKEDGTTLSGAKLQLYYHKPMERFSAINQGLNHKQSFDQLELVAEWTSTDRAQEFTKLKFGHYTLHEVEAPYGYDRTEDIEFDVLDTGELQLFIMEDLKTYSYIDVLKVDAADHNKVLAGAEFTMYRDQECTDEISKATTDENGWLRFDHLTYQTVYIKETKAPEGYEITDDIAMVVIDDEWIKEENSRTVVFADRIIQKIVTGDSSKSMVYWMLTSSIVTLAGCLWKKRKDQKAGE